MEITTSYSDFAFKQSSYCKMLNVLENSVRNAQASSLFEAIAFRGSSGACLAWPLFARTGIPLMHSRKPGSHYSRPIEGALGVDRYAIVDDFVETGDTIRTIAETIKKAFMGAGYARMPILTDVFLVKSEAFDPDDRVPQLIKDIVGYEVKCHGLYDQWMF